MNNDEKIREQLNSEPVPDRLRPENIKKMLDEQAPKKKRSGISMAGRITAAAAACAVIGGTAAYTMNNGKFNKHRFSDVTEGTTNGTKAPEGTTQAPELKLQASYMSCAKDYDQVYTMFEKASKKAEKERLRLERSYSKKSFGAVYDEEFALEEAEDTDFTAAAHSSVETPQTNGSQVTEPEIPVIDRDNDNEPEPATEPLTEPATEPDTEPVTEPDEPSTEPDGDETPDHSDTYNQEKDVMEADIVKTDGKHIFYVTNPYNSDYYTVPTLRVATVQDGKFTGSTSIDLTDVIDSENSTNVYVNEMYIYNGMLAVICSDNTNAYMYGSVDSYDERIVTNNTIIAFYTIEDEPQLIDVYRQDGYFHDVRISPDGFMLLITDYTSSRFTDIKTSSDTRRYIPSCGLSDCCEPIHPDDILIPDCGFGSTEWLSYSVIGSIDLNKSGAPAIRDMKTLAGNSGSIYCSADNLYVAANNAEDYNTTDITRISISNGEIIPMASTNIDGVVKDQFSMSEYDGYFRVAATFNDVTSEFHKYDDDDTFFEAIIKDYFSDDDGYYTYTSVKKDTRVYVLDMDMNMVGSVDGLGENEELKSASFSGNMAYVVTFRQTDPLYAVDLSNPAAPEVLDEFKINGFSTYMQSWGEGLLFGFGQDADENGRITGLRMTMFDNSDPNNLEAADVYIWENKTDFDYQYYSSEAVWDRKAILLAPEKNLIGVPISCDTSNYEEAKSLRQYQFFSFEDGQFVKKGEITSEDPFADQLLNFTFDRALYIGNHAYALSANKFVSVDLDSFEITDELEF
ncbi:beta-propeller domain-containing protein [uncultured Ruminococcus sp.]|uniref:beta-propeller domain-containing protein n=1 Tax=uncultured Ruminococcus sp. TaxID=165186 RepID=UPI0026132D95|nr:beta-propeller domain-containing protein [uncultured Ruminococcus sp.]